MGGMTIEGARLRPLSEAGRDAARVLEIVAGGYAGFAPVVGEGEAVLAWCRALLGSSAFACNERWVRFVAASDAAGRSAFGTVENALWDLVGRKLGVPLYELLGGALRQRVAIAAPVRIAAEESVEAVVAQAKRLVDGHGFRTLALLDGGTAGQRTASVLAALRVAFGPAMGLRLHLPAGCVRPARDAALTALGLEFLECAGDDASGEREAWAGDPPLAGGRGLAAGPLIAEMCRRGVVQVLVAEPGSAGGVPGIARLGALARAFQLELALACAGGSRWELALAVQLAATQPMAEQAVLCPDAAALSDVEDGMLTLSGAPGIGVDLAPGLGDAAPEDTAS
jgi:L-alanine-DL-glutamate epimerase-like enolase superfamily enzyme